MPQLRHARPIFDILKTNKNIMCPYFGLGIGAIVSGQKNFIKNRIFRPGEAIVRILLTQSDLADDNTGVTKLSWDERFQRYTTRSCYQVSIKACHISRIITFKTYLKLYDIELSRRIRALLGLSISQPRGKKTVHPTALAPHCRVGP